MLQMPRPNKPLTTNTEVAPSYTPAHMLGPACYPRPRPPWRRQRRCERHVLQQRSHSQFPRPTPQIGSCLLALALATLEVPAAGPGAPPEPAFSHSTSAAVTHVGGRYQTPGLVVAHPHVLEVLEGDEEVRMRVHVCQPGRLRC